MSISFQISKGTRGWSLKTGGKYDLTNWDIDGQAASIVCRPRPVDFIYMLLGTVLFVGLALFLIIVLLNPQALIRPANTRTTPNTLNGPSSTQSQPGPKSNLPLPSQSLKSNYQNPSSDVPATPSQIQEQLTRDLTPERRKEFEQRIKELQQERLQKRSANDSYANLEWVAEIMIWIGRVFAVLGIILFLFLGGALCLPRVLRHFRDYIEIQIRHGNMVITRPKVFGGLSDRQIRLNSIRAVEANSRYHARTGKYGSAYVSWIVEILTCDPEQPNIQFELEHLDGGASLEAPSQRVKQFANRLRSMITTPTGPVNEGKFGSIAPIRKLF